MYNMKILITNNDLSTRSGSELYVKELAEALIKRGHTIAAYSNRVGELADAMKKSGIEVVDDLSQLSWVPDIIHGQHHLEAMTAVSYFPGIPAIYVCHGWRPWQETPPLHPRIMEYRAVDIKTLEIAIREHNIPQDKIQLIHNFVNLERFKKRKTLPKKPEKALVFNNVANEYGYLPFVRQACKRAGITLDVVGSSFGNATDCPESILGKYDVVFAVGKSALEALAVGNAVVICNDYGVGPMVTMENKEDLRDKNFGVAAMHSGLDADVIYQELCNYDSEDSTLFTNYLRSVVGVDLAADEIEQLYMKVIEKYKTLHASKESEAYSFSSYLRNVSTLVKQKDQEIFNRIQIIQQRERELCRIYQEKEEVALRTLAGKCVRRLYRSYFKPFIPKVFFDMLNRFRAEINQRRKRGSNEIANESEKKEKFPESALAHKYLDGLSGIEIGGSAHNPFGLNTKNVDYTDSMETVFKKEEVNLCGEAMFVDIEARGDELPLSDESQDFVISSHVLEHFFDPIKALKEWYRVIKNGGYILIIVPHKERTFDKERPRTTLDELIQRHTQGSISKVDTHEHYSVWITEDVVALVKYLGWKIVVVQDVDDKVGNGFTIVIQK